MQLVSTTVVAYYRAPDFFLPATELMNSVLIFNQLDLNNQRLTGYFNTQAQSFTVDFRNQTYRYGNNSGTFSVDEFILDQFDVYLTPALYQRIFGLEFVVDMTNLAMRLYSEERLPIRLRQERLLARQRAMSSMGTAELYSPRIPRQYRLFRGTFLDYSLNINSLQLETFSNSGTFTAGAELLYGDVQGTLGVTQSNLGGTSLTWNNARWRFYNPGGFVRQIHAGAIPTRGITVNQQLIGVSATNEPLYPSRIFDEYTFTDDATPESEVEIYINDRLYDFLRVDEQGVFNVRLPITYGVNDVRIVKYAPDGQVTEVQQRLNVPFYFVPPKEFFYTAYLARTRVTSLDSDPLTVGLIDLAYGLNRSNTVRAKAELVSGSDNAQNSLITEYSNRLFNRVITNLQYSPERFTAANISYQTFGNTFVNVSGTQFAQAFQQVNNGIRYRYAGNAFFGLPVPVVPLYIRGGFDVSDFGNLNSQALDLGLTARVGRVAINSGFRNFRRQTATLDVTQRIFTMGSSYSISRSQDIFALFRGLFIRGQIEFRESLQNATKLDLALSKSVFRNGQLQLTYTNFLQSNQQTLFLSFSFDIPYARFNSSYRRSGTTFAVNQNVRGSVAHYAEENIWLFDSRQQVGRSAVLFNAFIDTDGDGVYSEGDQLLNYNVMRIQGAGARSYNIKNRMIVTQLRQYENYNVEVNLGLVQDPTLVPINGKFSITTDPNQFKRINVPFSRSGIVEGFVYRNEDRNRNALPGLTVRIRSESTGEVFPVRTFFDGSFYKMELVPGTYTMYPDSTQLAILGVRSEPESVTFEIEPSEFGDIFSADFDLFPLVPREPRRTVTPEPVVVAPPVVESTAQFFRIQTALMSTLPRAIMAKLEAEAATGAIFELQYSDRYKLFRLFSREIEGRENAVALLEVIRQKTQYSDAFIIDEDSYDAQDIFYAVQIGAFRTLRSATIHAREARDKFNLNAVVHFDSLSRWYVIHTLEWSDWRTASQIRMDIREQTDYKDAFLVTRPPVDLKSYTFAVQIGVYTNASFADRVTDDLRRRTGMPFSTQWNPRIELYSVRLNGITTWEEALQIREQLRTEFGVAESLILSISQ
jgi:hypothetical protein